MYLLQPPSQPVLDVRPFLTHRRKIPTVVFEKGKLIVGLVPCTETRLRESLVGIGAVIGQEDHERVVGLANRLQVGKQSADIRIHIVHHAGVRLHNASIEELLLIA